MPGTKFLDALLAAQTDTEAREGLAKLSAKITVGELLGGILLDDAGLSTDDVLRGVTVLEHDDVGVVDAVLEALRRYNSRSGGTITVLRHGSHGVSYEQAIGLGLPVVIATWDADNFDPREAILLADRVLSISDVGQPSIIAALTEAVSGTAVHLSADDASKFGFESLTRCVHLGSTGDDCARRIRVWLSDAELMAAASTDAEARKSDALPVGVVADGVVRRLSEMTGFGEARAWGMNLASDIRDYKAARLQWSDVDRGLLLSGPPGGGKTTFVRALALECDVPLEVTTYTDWSAAGGYGDSMSKGLTKLFDKWRKLADKGPYILFIDEIDTIGRRGGNGNNESWFTSVINAWLAFLDGAVSRDGIVVVAATNYPERVDPALLRPGRLDRHLELPMPDIEALQGIVRAHLGPDAVITDAELAEAARAVRGRSPAQVQQLARDARRVARWCKRRVSASDLVDVLAMQRLGTDASVDRQTAVHEAAHAVALVVGGPDRLAWVDIDAQRTSMVRGLYSTRALVEARLTMLLAARAAEETMLGAPTSGASRDLIDATHLALGMHGTWGMGSQGLLSVPAETAWADKTMRDAARKTLDEAYSRALDFVREHRAAIERVADALVTRRYLDGDEVRALVMGPVAAPAPVRRSAPMHGGRIARRVGPTPSCS